MVEGIVEEMFKWETGIVSERRSLFCDMLLVDGETIRTALAIPDQLVCIVRLCVLPLANHYVDLVIGVSIPEGEVGRGEVRTT